MVESTEFQNFLVSKETESKEEDIVYFFLFHIFDFSHSHLNLRVFLEQEREDFDKERFFTKKLKRLKERRGEGVFPTIWNGTESAIREPTQKTLSSYYLESSFV